MPALVCVLASARISQAQNTQIVNKVETGRVHQIDISDSIGIPGSTEPWQEIQVSAKARGELVSVPVDEGQPVKQGDVLFQQDMRADEIALAKATAELEKAQAELKKMHAGFQPAEVEAVRREEASAKSKRDAARDDWERLKPLAEKKIISAIEATRARSAFEVAESDLSRAEARRKLLESGFRSEEVQISYAGMKVQQAEVDDIKRKLDDHKIKAPATGTIVKKIKQQGEWVNEGDPVFAMVVLDPIKLRIEAPQANVSSVHPGQKAKVVVDGLGKKAFDAEVMRIIPQATERSRNFPVLLKVANPEALLGAGMYARVTLNVGESRKAITVPREAVRNLGIRQVVYRVDPLPGDFKWDPPAPPPTKAGAPAPPAPAPPDSIAREIEVDISSELPTEIVVKSKVQGQLESGSEIVVNGNSRLKDGSLLLRLNPVMPGAG